MKFAFVTCVQLGKSCIEKIYSIGGTLDLIITLKDNYSVQKSGRVYLDSFCTKNSIPLLKIRHINDAEVADSLKKLSVDWLFIIGWSQIASPELLMIPTKGVIGMHPTLLPEGRGRAAIPWAILKGLKKTGVTMFKLDKGVDTGPIIDQFEIPIDENENATSLYEKVNDAHIQLIGKVWHKLQFDKVSLYDQDDSKSTYWEGRNPDDGRIHAMMTTQFVDRLVRATTHPYPGAFYEANGEKLIIWEGQTKLPIIDDFRKIELVDGYYYCTRYSVI